MSKNLVVVVSMLLAVMSGAMLFGYEVLASSERTILTKDTDRVIVRMIDKQGLETTRSLSQEQFIHLNKRNIPGSSTNSKGKAEVDVLQPDFIRHIALQADSVKTVSWGKKRVGVDKLINKVTVFKGAVIVAVIDTGVDYTHALLKDRMVSGYDFVANDEDPMDMHFHGTHIAGTIADSTPPNVKIMPIRALDEGGEGYDFNIANGIRYAVDHGADIINMSFVGEGYSKYLADAIDYALSKNVLVVVASGNETGDVRNYYPASEKKIIVVSASDINDSIASFSNTGASIDLSAPGVDIISSVPGQKFESLSGTSMAAAYVSGVAAILKLEEPIKSIKGIEILLKKYVDDRGTVGWDSLYGEGIVNITSWVENLKEKNNSIDKNTNGKDESSPSTTLKVTKLPPKKDVPLDKQWVIEFTRELTNKDSIDIRILMDAVQISMPLTSKTIKKEIFVSTNKPYRPNTVYYLEIFVGKENKYEMQFSTK